MRAMARQAVRRFAGMEPGRPVGGTYYLYRTLRNLDLDGVLDRLMEQARQQADAAASRSRPLEERLEQDEYQTRIDQLKKEIEAEIRRGWWPTGASRPWPARCASRCPRTSTSCTPAGRRWRRCARPSTRSPASWPCAWPASAATAARARSTSAAPSATRSYGGVPAEPKFQYPRPSKPEIFVVADISGSVAAFARFTLHLVYAISNQFSKVRAFVFIDGIDEVTRFFEGVEDITEAVHRVNTEADVVWVDGHSDYGHAFEVFWQR